MASYSTKEEYMIDKVQLREFTSNLFVLDLVHATTHETVE